MFCKKCGKYIQPGQNFCPTCGTPVENNNTESMGDTKVIPGLNNMEDMGDTKVIPNLNELENQKSFGITQTHLTILTTAIFLRNRIC